MVAPAFTGFNVAQLISLAVPLTNICYTCITAALLSIFTLTVPSFRSRCHSFINLCALTDSQNIGQNGDWRHEDAS
jgi:hypothetical protein